MRRAAHARVANVLSTTLLCAAFVVVAVGAVTIWKQNQANKASDNQAEQVQQVANHGHTAAAPSTAKPSPSAFDAYHVPPDAPRYLFIPTLSVKAIVRQLGLTADSHLAVPTNVYDAGWYVGSAKPGEDGVTVLDGHVSSWTAHGVFYGLKDLRPGDTIRIQRGDGVLFTYTVAKSKLYDANNVDMNKVLAPVESGKPGLNLITCDGTVIRGTNEFSKRLVVFAYGS